MDTGRTNNASRQFSMVRLFWWTTFCGLTLAILKGDGIWAIVPGLGVCLLFVAQVWLDRSGK